MIKPIALAFALAMAFAPAAALAQYGGYGYMGPPGASGAANAPARMAHRPRRTPRPWVNQIPPEDQNLPAISRNPDDCVRQDHVHVPSRRRLLIGPSLLGRRSPAPQKRPQGPWGIAGIRTLFRCAPRCAARRASGRPPVPRPSAASPGEG